MMTDRPKVIVYLLQGHGWPVVKEKVYRFSPQKKKKNEKRLMAGSKISSLLFCRLISLCLQRYVKTSNEYLVGFICIRSSFKMQKMLVQVELNFFMTVTAMEKRNYTARNLLGFRSAYCHLKGPTIRKVMGGGGGEFSSRRNFFFVIKFLV